VIRITFQQLCSCFLPSVFVGKVSGERRDGGGMGMNKCIAVRKNDPVETYFSMTTMPLDGMNFQLSEDGEDRGKTTDID
jgi:hypothetical protein